MKRVIMPMRREEAEKKKLARYYTGTKCKHGHLAERYTANGSCVPCAFNVHKKRRARAVTPYMLSTHLCGRGHLARRTKEGKCIKCMTERMRQKRKERPWEHLIWNARIRAKKKGMPHNITAAWGKSIWTGKCAVTGIPFDNNFSFMPSIDRIDSKKGYLKNNCRFVGRLVNICKGNRSDEDLLKMAKAIVSLNKRGKFL